MSPWDGDVMLFSDLCYAERVLDHWVRTGDSGSGRHFPLLSGHMALSWLRRRFCMWFCTLQTELTDIHPTSNK